MASAATSSRRTVTAATRRVPTTTRRGSCRERRRRSDVRAKRNDVPVRAGTSQRSGAAASEPRTPAVYRRRRRFLAVAVAVAVTGLTLGAQATFTGSGRGPAFGILFAPWVLMPVGMACLVALVRSGSGGRRPASPSPAAGSATVETPMAHAA